LDGLCIGATQAIPEYCGGRFPDIIKHKDLPGHLEKHSLTTINETNFAPFPVTEWDEGRKGIEIYNKSWTPEETHDLSKMDLNAKMIESLRLLFNNSAKDCATCSASVFAQPITALGDAQSTRNSLIFTSISHHDETPNLTPRRLAGGIRSLRPSRIC
jgi:hypothetical protein